MMNTEYPQTEIAENIEGLQSSNDKIREQHFKILYPLSLSNPELLYPYWDIFIEMLHKAEVSNKYYAIHLLARLIKVDFDNRFNEISDYWFNELLNDESPVVSLHIAEKSGMIALAKPKLEKEITARLLNIDETSKCRHIDLQKAYVLSAFDSYFERISDKRKVIEFILDQQNSPSTKTKKKAKELVRKYDIK
ncbi:MAG TPA: hypothetical protein PK335_13555 [Draconibacterium sp.]|nr:hypothetical protein [Draconibacterium sp.]